MKRAVAKPTTRKRLTKAGRKRAGLKKIGENKARSTRSSVTPPIETVTVDVSDERASGVITVAEFAETEVRERNPEQPEQGSMVSIGAERPADNQNSTAGVGPRAA